MKLLIVICLLPVVLSHGGNGSGRSHNGDEARDYGHEGKSGILDIHGRVAMMKRGDWVRRGERFLDHMVRPEGKHGHYWSKRHERGEDDSREVDMDDVRDQRQWGKDDDDEAERRHGRQMWSAGDGEDDEGRRHGGKSRDNEDERERGEDRRHGRKSWTDEDDTEDDEGRRHGRKSRDDEDEREHGEDRRHGRKSWTGEDDTEDDEVRRHGRKSWTDEDDKEDDEGRRHGRKSWMDKGDEDREGRHHGTHGRNYRSHSRWGKLMHGDDDRDEVRRAYFRFYGKFNMNGGKGMMHKGKHADRDEDDKERHGHGYDGWKRKDRNGGNDEQYDDDDDMMGGDKMPTLMLEKRIKMGMKRLYKQDPHELGKLVTLSFLKMCECEGDDAARLLKEFVAKADGSDDKDDQKKTKLPEIPDFGTDTNGKIDFLRNLTEEQRQMLFGYDLVKNMCVAAKRYMVKSKEFYEKYFTLDDSMMTTTEQTP